MLETCRGSNDPQDSQKRDGTNTQKTGVKVKREKKIKKHLDIIKIISYIKDMNVTISKHALDRMEQRGISEAEVRQAFDTESWESVDISSVDETILIVTKTFNGKKWHFLYNHETNTLVTCYPKRGRK